MREIAHHLLEAKFGFAQATAAVLALPHARLDANVDGERCYLDTRDRGLLHHNLVLECDRDPETTTLNLRTAGRMFVGAAWEDRIPQSAVDLLDGDMRQAIVDAIGAQSFAVIGQRALRLADILICDDAGNANARVVIGQWRLDGEVESAISVRLLRMRGGRSGARAAADELATRLPIVLAPSAIDPVEIDYASAELPDVFMRDEPLLGRDETIDAALTKILAHHFGILTTREPGIEADLDTEFLHDFRIALRRMRSLFDAFRTTFDKRIAGLLKADLKWLNQATGGRRDLDVFLHQFPALRSTVPHSFDPALDSLREFIVDERASAQERLVAALRSKRYDVFITDWNALLNGPALREAEPSRNVVEAAGESIWKTYRRIRKQALDRRATKDIDSLHALRKDCKKLRYQIESFRSVFPRKRLGRAVNELKHLQDMLGAVCDLSVQQQFLIHRRKQLIAQLNDPGEMERLLAELLGRYADEEARLRRSTQSDLDRFAGKAVMQRYRELFHEH